MVFVQKVNKIVMESYEQEANQDAKIHEKFLNKDVSLLMLQDITKLVKDKTLITKLKILSFNNLSCIYKKKKKFGIALRSISYAV